jgi:HK97 family phage portal protein
MRYETDSGIVVTDRRHYRSDDPRSWPSNPNVDPPPPDGPGVGPNMSEGFGNDHVMYPAETTPVMTEAMSVPPVMPWSGWPVEWDTPNWGSSAGVPNMISKISTVYGCIDMNSSILAAMPPYRLVGKTVVSPVAWMNNPQPEVYTGWIEAMKQVVTSYYGAGEAFLWATSRYADNTVRNWVMLDPAWVDVQMMGQIRRYYMNGIDISEDVLHLRYSSWPGQAHGFGPLGALASNLFGVAAMEKYQANLAARGGIPWGVLTAPGNLKQAQAQALRDNFVSARMSAMGAPATLSGGVTLTPFSMNPKDMALLELRMFDEARICTLLGVPPLLMGLPSGDSMTYRNAEGIYDHHWRAFLRPKASALMEAISHWSLPTTQSVELNRDDYVRPAFNERVTGYQTLFNLLDPITGERAITIDEIRAAERLAVLDNAAPAPPPSALDVAQGVDNAP